MRNIRIFWQIFPTIVLITFCALFLSGWLVDVNGRAFYLEQIRTELLSRARLLEVPIEIRLGRPIAELQEFCRQSGRRAATRITVVDHTGRVLADSDEDAERMDNHANRPELQKALAGAAGDSTRFSRTLGKNMLYVALPIKDGNGTTHALRLSVPLTAIDAFLSTFNSKLALGFLSLLALSATLAYFSSRRLSRPLEEMRLAAEKLSGDTAEEPVIRISSAHMSKELATLAMALNRMAEQISSRMRIINQQRSELEAVFASMAEPVVAIDADRTILRMNRAAAEFFKLPADMVKGKEINSVIRNKQMQALIARALADNSTLEEEIILYEGAGRKTLQTHAVPLLDEQNRSIGALMVMNDLTTVNWLENVRQDFVANVSHELKTPITAIRGYVETLQDGALENGDDARRFLEIVARQASRLDAIIDDLLTLSRLEGRENSAAIHVTPEEICPLLEAAKQTCAMLAQEKDIAVAVNCTAALTAQINKPLLEQAVINLLVNAISYSPAGTTVTLQATGGRSLDGRQQVRIDIIDQGPGIAKEHLPRLFERFYRCDKARSREIGGTGLGLAIVKHIAQAHNGTVEVESKPGAGSTFTIVLPLLTRDTGANQ